MKLILRLIISLVLIVGLVALIFSYQQARQEEGRLKAELGKRADVIAESLKMLVEPPLTAGNTAFLQQIMDTFSNREKLEGVDVHDIAGNLVAISKGLSPQLDQDPHLLADNIAQVKLSGVGYGQIIGPYNKPVYVYSLPLITGHKITHVLSLFYNVDYIQERVHILWMNSFWRLLVQILLIAVAVCAIILLNVMRPIRQVTEWIRKVRKGEGAGELDARNEFLLGPLVSEIGKMAQSLEMARLSAEEEARLRHSGQSLWTPERLKEVVRLKLGDRPLFVVSNREPYMHNRNSKGKIECIVPASGLVTALEPVLNACGGTWIAQGSGDADREVVDQNDKIKVPPEEPKYTLRRVWIDKDIDEGFYSGFSNEGLWPLCHIAHTRPIFRAGDWEDYRAVNKKFAEILVEEMEGSPDPYVLIQDYHFALLAQMIKTRRPDARVALFWHIPWPNPESFGICPWYKDLLKGMLGADLLGFHTQFHCNNFIESVDRFLESRIDYEHFSVNREGHTTLVRPFPISISAGCVMPASNSSSHAPAIEDLLKPYNLQARWMGVGVDRLDYTKGILERLRAIENLMDKEPAFNGAFTFVELGAPSRTMIPKYKEFVDEIVQEAQRINARFKTKNWQPILLLMKHHSHADIAPFYKAAHVCLVTSLHDGMNLVAKEFISARDDEQGVLILSQFTGAARELRDALIVNPYDIGQMSQAIKEGLLMDNNEQAERMKRMRNIIKERNIYRWAGELVGQLTQVRL
ncbi:MAG: trehalose-6-phosphate synthase [Candidatus Omnitrophica bacterium]|nr:trehalose-6-phosphate synthase [Candidatus Omnitrophota bacterium]